MELSGQGGQISANFTVPSGVFPVSKIFLPQAVNVCSTHGNIACMQFDKICKEQLLQLAIIS